MERVKARENRLKICQTYIEPPDPADILHAATCLQTNATLISNDHHVNRIRDEATINGWNATDAMKKRLQ